VDIPSAVLVSIRAENDIIADIVQELIKGRVGKVDINVVDRPFGSIEVRSQPTGNVKRNLVLSQQQDNPVKCFFYSFRGLGLPKRILTLFRFSLESPVALLLFPLQQPSLQKCHPFDISLTHCEVNLSAASEICFGLEASQNRDNACREVEKWTRRSSSLKDTAW
jgi:hypothetical protein